MSVNRTAYRRQLDRLVMWAGGKLGYYLVATRTVALWVEAGQELHARSRREPHNSKARNALEGQANAYRHAVSDVLGTSPHYELPT